MDLVSTRDSLADKYRDDCFKLNPDGFTVSTYCNDDTLSTAFAAGFDAALRALSESAGAFDYGAMDAELYKYFGRPADHATLLVAKHICKWQHAQDAARIGLLKEELATVNALAKANFTSYQDKLETLEARLAELGECKCKSK